MNRRSKKRMWVVLGIIGLIISIMVIYFNVPYSRLKGDFKNYLAESEKNTNAAKTAGKYVFNDLPGCMQKFYNYTGLMKKVSSKHVSFDFRDADFVNTEMKKTLKIDYSEHIFADVPARFAFIDSSLFGIPFQGLDSFIDGKGGMKGVVAKNITLFDQRGKDMDKAALVTWLAEIIFMPSELLNGQIEIKELDKNSVSVSITYDNITVGGVYKFKDNGEIIEFITDDRAMSYTDGRIEHKKWSALYEEYTKKGELLLPDRIKAEWHLDDSDLVYFNGGKVQYNFY
ncbi:MAG: hypothetical protein LIR50_21570 [Bacillota bacterium]|nr:hypothetical protein [Bacillota bacterium]